MHFLKNHLSKLVKSFISTLEMNFIQIVYTCGFASPVVVAVTMYLVTDSRIGLAQKLVYLLVCVLVNCAIVCAVGFGTWAVLDMFGEFEPHRLGWQVLPFVVLLISTPCSVILDHEMFKKQFRNHGRVKA